MTTDNPIFKRERRTHHDNPVPLAFVFDGSTRQPEHSVTVVRWTDGARQKLQQLDRHLYNQRSRSRIPVVSLRGRLEVSDESNLRLDRSLALKGTSPIIFWTARDPAAAQEETRKTILGWLVDDVSELTFDDTARSLIEDLKGLARRDLIVTAVERKARVFDWNKTRSGTATLNRTTNPNGYSDLADYVVRMLEGKELLPARGGLRRIASGRLDQNQAELMTDPIRMGIEAYSIVVRVKVFSYPGRSTPVLVMEVSRRTWTDGLRGNARVKELSAYALPEGTTTALRFTLEKVKVGTEFQYQPQADFVPIARKYGLDLRMSAGEIIQDGQQQPRCKLVVVHKNGVGRRVKVKQGIPDLDKMDVFKRAAELLSAHGLTPWQGMVEVDSDTRPVKDRDQKWRNRDEDEDGRLKFEKWQQEAKAAIAGCYQGAHHLVIGHHPDCRDDALRAKELLEETLGNQVRVQFMQIPHDVHGPRARLPRPGSERPQAREYAELRVQAWKPFVTEFQRYQAHTSKVDGLMIIAPRWYEQSQLHDDTVNKRAARITLAKELGIPVQYLRPEREDGQRFSPKADPARAFDDRVMIAWLDLAWKNLGRVKHERLNTQIQKLYQGGSEGGVEPPDRVIAVGIIRRNSTGWIQNEKSFVPFAIELDVERGVCSARFARENKQQLEITPLASLPETLVALARSGPIQLSSEKDGEKRREQIVERSQRFFHQAITEACQRAKRPLVLIDAVACRGVWPWLSDEKLDADNVLIGGHPHAEADWDNARIVRIRTGNSPKVLFTRYYEGTCEQSGDVVRYDAPDWAEAQLFRLTDARNVYLSFGSAIRTGLVAGRSCHREVEGLKPIKRGSKSCTKTVFEVFNDMWGTPTAIEFTIVRTTPGETPDQLAQVVEWLRSLYAHFGEWTTKPAPLYFETALKDYVADYDFDDEEEDENEEEEGET